MPKKLSRRIRAANKLASTAVILYLLLGPALNHQAVAKTANAIMATSKDPNILGEAIAAEHHHRNTGFHDLAVAIEMILHNAHGQSVGRKMRLQILEQTQPGDGDKSLIIFDSPADVKGTSLLSHAKILAPDDQWLYLPAVKRVKRISSTNKSGPFVGSELAYEDITSDEVAKYSWKYISTEYCPNQPKLQCFKLESYPKYRHSGYTKRINWLDTEHFRTQQIQFYDRKQELSKTLTIIDYRQYLDRYWRGSSWHMVNHQNGKDTRLNFAEFRFQTGLSEYDFSQESLKNSY